jgi:hypothetical protein
MYIIKNKKKLRHFFKYSDNQLLTTLILKESTTFICVVSDKQKNLLGMKSSAISFIVITLRIRGLGAFVWISPGM